MVVSGSGEWVIGKASAAVAQRVEGGGAGAPLHFNPQARICSLCPVRRQALLGLLEPAALESLHWRIADLSFSPGQALFTVDQPAGSAYTVREGLVALKRSSETGEPRIVRLAGRGDLIGPESVIGQTYATTAVAMTAVKACQLPRGMIEELVQQSPAVRQGLMARWQKALDEADEWIVELMGGSARWRMLRLLLKLSEYGEPDGRIWLPSRLDMAAMLGLTVETTSRLVSHFKREGLLRSEGRRRAMLSQDALMAALREEARRDQP